MPDPRIAVVEVILTGVDAAGNGIFDLKPAGFDPLDAPANDGHKTLTFDNKSHPGVRINFVLIDLTGRNHSFLADPTDAVWSDWGPLNSCPSTKVNAVLKPESVSGYNNTVLSVLNENKDGGPKPGTGKTFGYVLWLTDPHGGRVKIDPGGSNMNGQSFTLPVGAILVGAIAGAALMVALLKLNILSL